LLINDALINDNYDLVLAGLMSLESDSYIRVSMNPLNSFFPQSQYQINKSCHDE